MRALVWFWGVVLLVLLAVGGMLQALGPPSAVMAVKLPLPVAAPHAAAWNGQIADPNPALLQPGRNRAAGLLPRVAGDGRTARKVYARPAPAPDGRPRVALVLAGFGAAEADSRAAVALPGAVTLAVSAYARDPDALLAAARAAGHELLASLPMESLRFPLDDAGQHSLLTGAAPEENLANLEIVMGRLQGYVGMTGVSDGLLGERFAAQSSSFAQVLEELGRRGLLYVDPRPPGPDLAPLPPGVAGRNADLVLDDTPARANIEGRLAELERIARARGSAIGVAARLRPVTLERVAAWARDAETRGIVLIPVSALVPDPDGAPAH